MNKDSIRWQHGMGPFKRYDESFFFFFFGGGRQLKNLANESFVKRKTSKYKDDWLVTIGTFLQD